MKFFSVISLITLYNPTNEHLKNAKKIAEQSTLTILIDNSYNSNESLVGNEKWKDKIVYCPNYDNLGLSMAFNKCLEDKELYDWKKDDFVIFFDQDSTIDEGHIPKLIEEYIKLEEQGIKIGCIGPAYFDKSHGSVRTPKAYKRISDESIIVDSIMTSSMVCRYKNIKMVGFWSEDIFLDMADWDICWKMKKRGLVTVMTSTVLLTHTVGEGSKQVGPITLDIAKPFREYYETRDCIYLLKKDYVPLKDRIRFYLQLTIRPLLHLMFLDDKEERKYYIKLGIKHAKYNVKGSLINEWKWH